MLDAKPKQEEESIAPHHAAWLNAHPHRTLEWLRQRTKDGFDVHHIDGDHSNNDPKNLILIEHTDHMGVHGGKKLGRLTPRRKPKPEIVGKTANPLDLFDLWAALRELGWTQKKLAQKLGVTPGSISGWKQGGAPGYAKAYLRAGLSLKRSWQEFDS